MSLARPEERAPSDAGCFSGDYHDNVWGTPITDSHELFAQLSLCTQQAGVSWSIVWNKREHYRSAFHGFDMRRVAAMTEADVDGLCDKEGRWKGKLLQNRRKLEAIVHNARICVGIEERHPGGLSGYLWSFVAGREADTQNRHARDSAEYAKTFGVTSEFSDAMEKKMKKCHKGSEHDFKFLGSITLQAFLLQNGLLNGHAPGCCRNPRFQRANAEEEAAAAATPAPTSKRRCPSLATRGEGKASRLA